MNAAEQFEAIVSDYYELLFRFAKSLTGADCDALDLTQQTFYIWATKGHQLRDASKVKSWLFTTLHRTFLVAHRKQSKMTYHDLDVVSEQLPALPPTMASHSDCSQVLIALAGVDDSYRAAVALFYLDDCSYLEIAEILEVPIGTVKSRIARGIAQLRKFLSSDNSPSASRAKDWIPAKVAPVQAAVSDQGKCVALDPSSSSRVPEGGYDEWDLSSTLLREPLTAP